MNFGRKLFLIATLLIVTTTQQHEQQPSTELAKDPMAITLPGEVQLAGRYYLRNRTNRFYQRAGRGYQRTAVG